MEVNGRQVRVHIGNGIFELKKWENVNVGDVVMVERDAFFPADLLLLSSSYPDGICYVETMNLDGETNLKIRKSLEATAALDSDSVFAKFGGFIKCEDPNPNLYTFIGSIEISGKVESLSAQQVLLRDSKLRNTHYIYGVVIFSGHDTKVMQNATQPPSKRSSIERKMDQIIYVLFLLLLSISFIGSVVFGVSVKIDMPLSWYLRPDSTGALFRPVPGSFLHFVTALILYGYLIPISLYVSIEVVKIVQAKFINQDLHMFHDQTDKPAHARTSNLNEELGQVETILSDKTGTLTCNVMDFLKCSICGVQYGRGISEVERAVSSRLGKSHQQEEISSGIEDEQPGSIKPKIKNFSFNDERLLNGNWIKEKASGDILMFFHILAVCHTAIPEEDEETGVINYEAESPDETAFVTAAREFGFEFYKRTQSSVHLKEFDPAVREFSCREYKILDLLEFNSTRKRMSVIIRDSEGQLFLFCKGADSVMFERLADNGRAYEQATKEHLTSYGEAGLRTLVIAYRKLVESEYSEWRAVFLTAKSTVGAERESLLDDASALIEKDLILIGATAVEDKLQKGVPECIDRLAQAGLKIWVLTGDKLETAINIGFACSLLREGMKQIVVTMDNETITKTANEVICQQIVDGQQQIENETDPEAAYALIIDGKALTFGLQPNSKDKLLHLALNCASVICCRVSPKQKALVTKLVRESTQKVTLAIGDGANDVGMIQEADIGVGISGVEGMQAVMASDFAIAQFRFLEHLLLVHGHWCYKRISLMVCYFFYKNLTFGLTLFYFEAHTRFSGQAMYNDWAMSLFNVAFTSLPVMALGIFEQDVTAQVCLQFPALYHQGPTNLFFNWFHIMGWICNAIYNSILTFFVGARIYKTQAFCNGGQTAGIDVVGTSMYTCIISTLTFQISLVMTYFTWIQHFCIWGSILVWYVFLVVYGFITPSISSTAYKLFVEVLSPSPKYWLVTIVVTTACLLPYFAFMVFQQAFKPMDHQIIEEIKYMQKDKKEPQMWINEQAKAILHTLIGTTARVEAKIRKLLLRVQERK